MKKRFYFRILFFSLTFLMTCASVQAEGTKEVEPDGEGNPCKLHLSKYTNPTNESYNNFALYVAADNERLQFTIGTLTETVYFGFHPNAVTSGWPPTPSDPQITCRIKNAAGTVVWGPQMLPWETGNTGYIDTYNQAFLGPSNLPGGTGGYDPLIFVPAAIGDYYIEFDFPGNNQSRTFDFFDITVANSSGMKIPGRVWSKAWQFTTDGNNNTSTAILFPYSDDGITTSINLNGISPYRFAISCNQTGCSNTGNIEFDRKSVEGKHTYPQYRIFLNEPDHTIPYFAIGELGQLISASVASVDCNGTVVFNIVVNKSGQIIMTLDFPPPYIDRQIQATVTGGSSGNNVPWDGKDGVNTPVANGVMCSVSIEYINGLTNLPLYDAEYMNSGGYPSWSGYIVTLVAPTGNPIPLFWDDTPITGCGSGSNYTGCLNPAGCHPWDFCIGDANTVNTWWYALSSGTATTTVLLKRYPANPGTITGDNQVCQGAIKMYSVVSEPNSTSYEWTWPAGAVPIGVPPYNTNSITLDYTGATASGNVTVRGWNDDCGFGSTSTLTVTLHPVPSVTTPSLQNSCSGVNFSIPLNSSVTGTFFSSIVNITDCSSNITTCPTGTFSGASINGNLSVTDLNPGTVVYHVTPSAGICTGATKTIVVTVAPKPNVTSPSTSGESFCSGGSTNVVLQSGLTGPSLSWNWEVLLGNCNNIQTCPTSGTTSPISNTLILGTNTLPGSIIYTITPTYGGCAGDPVNYAVTVFQLPDVVLPPFAPVCLNTPTFTLSTGTPAGGTYLYQGNPITTFNPATMGVGVHTITYTYTDLNGCTSSDQKSVVVQGLITPNLFGSATACIGVAQSYSTDGGMVPSSYQWSVSPDGIITGATPETRSITWNTTGVKTISVIYTDPNGCQTIPANYQVTVNSLPVPTVAGNNNVCYQKTYTYTTESGMTGYVWNVSPGNTLVASGNSASVTWNVIGSSEWVEVNYINGNGCTAVTPERRIVNVNASPSYTVTGDQTVCAGTTGVSYSIPAGLSIYAWSVSSGGIISGPATNNSVLINWMTTATANQTVSVSYTNSLGCSNITNQPVTIHPLPVATFTTSTPSPVCQDYPTPSLFTVDASGPASTYLWQITPPTLGVMTDPTANPLSVTWKLPGTSAQSAQLRVTATTTGAPPLCSLTSLPMTVVINPKPHTQLQICFDAVTTQNAKPFVLKGGLPLGSSGVFRIDNLSGSPVTTITPAALSIGNHTIYYTYTDNNGCIATDSKILRVDASNAGFSCGSLLTDPRDNQVYKTVLIGGKCWMQENLRYHTANPAISHLSPQTDNCVWEKYCLSTDPTCSLYGGMYQWDELMQYTTATKGQGFCPPGWHVPDDAEWAVLINAISSLTPGDGIAGSYLRDVNATGLFKAGPAGVFYLNSLEAFSGQAFNASFFWTSTVITAGRAVTRGLNDVNPSVSFYEGSKADAFPVRCVKDN
ncbi:MAG TPA: FISUMP domain-containing protein [Bacteroidales bacterium]|nr:FISUMP domain-containing protein [Bacteroidales bacterium]